MALLSTILVSCTGAPHYRGPSSDHFNGQSFANTIPMKKGAGDLARFGWGSLTKASTWPDWVEVEQRKIPNERVHNGLSITYVNHASFLIQVDGVNILTDPIYSKRASPFQWAGPKRVHSPGVRFEDLPPIDVVLISHNHYDHMDEATLKRFASDQAQPLVLAGLGNGELLDDWQLNNHKDMDWEDHVTHRGVEFVFTECRHRSGRGAADQMKTLWGSFVIKSSVGNIYFAGDSGYSPHFKETGDKHGPFELSLLPIGAYEPRWFMRDVHVDPAEAVMAHRDLRSKFSVGMHFGTFQLTYEPIDQPVIDLELALQQQNVDAASFITLEPGDTRKLF